MESKYFKVRTTKKYGRGLYATKNIKKGEIVEVSPILVLGKEEAGKISDTLVNVYVFEWNKDSSALAFGHGSLFNHSRKSSVTYMNSFNTKEIVFMATKNIRKGEQLFINYGYEPEYGLMVTKRNKQSSLMKETKKQPVVHGYADPEYGMNKEKPLDKLKYEN